MSMFFETSCRYEKMQENGSVKRVTEKYLVDSLSVSEAEARTIEEVKPYISGELSVKTAKCSKVAEVVGDTECGKFYLAQVGFISIDEKTAVEKRSVTQILVGAEDFASAYNGIKEAMKTTLSDWELVSLAESPILDVFKAIQ